MSGRLRGAASVQVVAREPTQTHSDDDEAPPEAMVPARLPDRVGDGRADEYHFQSAADLAALGTCTAVCWVRGHTRFGVATYVDLPAAKAMRVRIEESSDSMPVTARAYTGE